MLSRHQLANELNRDRLAQAEQQRPRGASSHSAADRGTLTGRDRKHGGFPGGGTSRSRGSLHPRHGRAQG